jgi:hypothetical protein
VRNDEPDGTLCAGVALGQPSAIVKQRLAIGAVREQYFVVPKSRVQLTQREYHPMTVTRLGASPSRSVVHK